MKRFILLLLAITAFPFVTIAQLLDESAGQCKSAEAFWKKGNAAIEKGDTIAALSHYKEAARLYDNTVNRSINDDCFQQYLSCLYSIGNIYSSSTSINPDYSYTLRYYQLHLQMLENNGVFNTYEYYVTVRYLFGLANQLGEDQTVMEAAPKYENLIFMYSETPVLEAYDYTTRLYGACARTGQYDKALSLADESLELAQIIKGDSCWVDKVDLAYSKAQIYQVLGNKKDATVWLNEGKSYLNKVNDRAISDFLKAKYLSLEGRLLEDYNEAMVKLDSAQEIMCQLIYLSKKTLSEIHNVNGIDEESYNKYVEAKNWLWKCQKEYAGILTDKGYIQCNNGDYDNAVETFNVALEVWKDFASVNSDGYLACLQNIALCQMRMGHYAKAMSILDDVANGIISVYGKQHPLYVSCLSNYCLFYSSIYDYDKVIAYGKEAAEISQSIGSTTEYVIAVMNQCSGYLSKGELLRAQTIVADCIDMIESKNITIPEIHRLYIMLGMLLCENDKTSEGEAYFKKAKQEIEFKYGKESEECIDWNLSYAGVLLRIDDERAFGYYKEAVELLLGLKNEYYSNTLRVLLGYGYTGIKNDEPIFSGYTPTLIKAIETSYYNNVSFYSTEDKAFYWDNLQSKLLSLLFSYRKDDLNDISIFHYLTFEKGLLLSSYDSFKQAIFNTGQEALIDQYNNIQAIQREIDMQSFSIQSDNQLSELLFERKTSMERQLMAEMRALGYSANDSITYYNVRRLLKHDEIAIEFVDYYHLKEEKTYYIALLAKSSWENPVYVQLCTEGELKSCIGNPNVTYSTDDLYRLLWQPLAKYINEGDKVYFSPSGMLHTIALESLHTPDGSCLSDKYNLVRLTSTRELCKERQPKNYETGAVYGGLQYDVDQQRMTEVAAMIKTASEESPVFALRGEDRGNWNYLQGTKDEVEHIAGIMRQANIGCELFEGDLGNEESFKALSGSNTDIIHLATHGYFIEGEKADMNDFMQSLSPLARQKTDSIIDPLLRSGLILSGGNRAWLGQEVPEGIEDGVLTALEISTMNLTGTDMVVMSACETGLGDITSDGVFGLQRAFKMAGVQTLVMSLWKVDDNATSLMMQTFYEHLLSGMSKREAFNFAQAAVRAKYPEPYYWAGFVMLD